MPRPLRTSILSWYLAGCVLSTLVLPAGAPAQTRPAVTLEARGLFGDELVISDAYSPVLIQARNDTRRTLRGRVVATVRHWQTPASTHHAPLDLPPEADRTVLIELFVPEGASVNVRYVVDGDTMASAVLSPGYTPATEGIVVLADPPRLRGALLDMEVDQPQPSPGYAPPTGTTAVRLPVGAVPFDPATGDPVLPLHSVGWATTGLLVASAPDLSRAGAAEQRAIVDWIRSGGEILVFPRTDADLSEPFVASLVGEVERFEGTPTTDQQALVPPAARGSYFRSADPDFRTEAFGGSRRMGFGMVYVAAFDGAHRPLVDAAETRSVVNAVLATPHTPGVVEPAIPFGRRQDDLSDQWWGGGAPSFGALRAALDPNEGYRPALGLVAVVLLLYVVFVGPVNFAFVRRTSRPTFALVTTPVAAVLCLAVMLGVGYLGKGTKMRYRSVEIVELQERDALGPGRRYTGLFLTRPAVFDLEPTDNGIASVVRPSSADAAIVDHGGERPALRRVRGRLWETVFVREERVVDHGGGVRFSREAQRLVTVHNDGAEALRGAVIVDSVGSIYRVGDIPPGGQAPVGQTVAMTVDPNRPFYGEDDPALGQLAGLMALPSDHRKTLEGVSKVLGGSLSSSHVPVMIGWQEVERGELAGTFGREMDVRFLRVVPQMERHRVTAVYAQDPYGQDPYGHDPRDADPHFPQQDPGGPTAPMPPDVVEEAAP